MSAVESKLLSEKSTAAPQIPESDSPAGTAEPASKRDNVERVSAADVCRIARQLATLLRAGMPLVPALSALLEQLRMAPERKLIRFGCQENPLARIMEGVRDSVNAGSTLSGALSKHPDVFSPLFVNMVAAGQTSGTLEELLVRLADMLEKRRNLAGKVKSAIAYPLMMAAVAVGVVVFLLSFVVPSITQIFLEMNRALPWPTRALIWTSTFIKDYLVFIIIAVCALVFAIAAGYRTKEGRLFVDRSKLKLPLFGNLFLKLEIARLTRTLGTLLASGILILDALEIAKGVVHNTFIAHALRSVKDSVSKGDNIASSIRKTGLFPPVVFHIMATGQIGGNLEDGLIDIAEMYDREVEMTTKTLTSLLEPMILLIMGLVVGFIVLAILLPIFEINQLL
ncbi:MAG: type II secretion system F family protein [Phycisphaerales bacterium]|nr:MAG: type II secretion system F family protein [Phycisphaerales bacterium]